ncbi:MAG: tRNA 2-thiouridine(34) synthase MnmA [Gammaproteobacteria bacterium]|nr:tRNA 2-thiouridine(34) synthase MnmA [Gammaproteobacteria bacterium]
MTTARHIVVAVSGGVDSSVAALELVRAGHHVTALFMKNWNEPLADGRCRWEDDVADALEVCDTLGIELNTVDLSQAYWDGVFKDFLDEYARGRTPNPDVLCNREVKFKAFLAEARARGGEAVATGHYARIRHDAQGHVLLKGLDGNKDQSYFLYTLSQAQLAATLFPVGHLPKADVRARAAAAGLVTHAKKDSTGICFIGEQRFREFLARFLPAQRGAIETLDGRTIGEHQGVIYYTLGQREGLGIGGVKGAAESPWFVAAKDVARNVLIVVQGHDHPALLSRELEADSLSWVAGAPPALPYRCTAKTRYRQPDQPCTLESLVDGRLVVRFDQAQRAVTPGQSVVFYAGEVCLGGGIIDVIRS